ncbi:serine hydrolase domain-containing protein [Pacificimonas flava]|uniref:Beta-lactamase class C n=1 Tax=Pacificimonas flava TaxID=1234595 RepID=M2T539_9SPHN|nr:serine hydrolase [Pacificimonas flava]EMD81604.1 Beta-lactamase class C [Pacificimonas flava]MBB5280405.1 CubicO group peptidase (beta-lactamase class C family) [Pacificimonas flava]
MDELDARISNEGKYVAVEYDRNMPPRIAAWREYLGCTQLPIGATLGMVSLPTLPADVLAQAPQTVEPLPETIDTSLAPLIERAFDGRTYGNGNKTTGILIVRDGRIVGERYAHGIDAQTPQRTWSVAKSIAGSVLGVAAERGLINLMDPAAVPEWQERGDPRGQITTEQLMRMASGLTSDFPGNRTDAIYVGGTAVADSAPGQSLLHEPGSTFRYANNDTLLALYGLRNTMDDDAGYRALPFTGLLWKLGMMHTYLETDWRGDFVMSSQVWTTARDLARLGLLYLADGVWDGERLLPENYGRFVSAPTGPQPDREWGYGATFWTATEQAGLPQGTFSAMGNRGQYLVIVPEQNLLVIRRGFDPVGEDGGFDITAFARDVVATAD